MFETRYHQGDIGQFSFLVTGGAGFIGSNIVEYLLKYGAGKVRVLDDLSTGFDGNVKGFIDHPSYEFIEGSITDANICIEACNGIDIVLHQAALGSVPRSIAFPDKTNAANVTGFINILLAAKEKGVKRLVYASSSSVYGDSLVQPKVETQIGKQISPYAVSKYVDELYAYTFHLNYGMELIGLRYFNVFGPRQNPMGEYAAVIPKFIYAVLNNEQVFIDGDGTQSRDFTYVENAVQANIKAAFTQNSAAFGKAFNVAVGESYSINEMFDGIKQYLNKPDFKAIHRESRQGDVKNSLADISLANALLGYEPSFRFQDGLAKTIEYFQAL